MTTVVAGTRETDVKAHIATIYRAPLNGAPLAALQRAWDAVCAGFEVAPALILLAAEDYRAYSFATLGWAPDLGPHDHAGLIAFNGCPLLARRHWPVGVAGFLCDELAVVADPPPLDRRSPVWAVG